MVLDLHAGQDAVGWGTSLHDDGAPIRQLEADHIGQVP
jgi:hypothetical protein